MRISLPAQIRHLLASGCLCCIAQAADTYYVATTGSNANPGTLAAPWKTIGFAVNAAVLKPGDAVVIRGGTYAERVIMRQSGTPAARITVGVQPGEQATIDGKGISWTDGGNASGLFEVRASHVVIDGLRVINSKAHGGSCGITVQGPNLQNIVIRRCRTKDTQSSGISAWGNAAAGSFNGVTDLVIEDNVVEACLVNTGPFTDPVTKKVYYTGWNEHITIAKGVDRFEVRRNEVFIGGHVGSIGIDAKQGVRNGRIWGNWVHDMVSNGIYVDAYDESAYAIEIHDNVVRAAGVGLSVGAEQGGTVHDIAMWNNVAYDCRYRGLQISGRTPDNPCTASDLRFYNNTLVNNGYGAACIWGLSPRVTLKNNIFAFNPGNNGLHVQTGNDANVSMDRNLLYPTLPCTNTNFHRVDGTGSIAKDPLFFGVADFRLTAASPAIDRGLAVILASPAIAAPSVDLDGKPRPLGAACDLGAYESGALAPANRAPVAVPQSLTTPQGTAKPIVLAATDADGDALAYAIVAQPLHGTLIGTGANRSYIPAAGYAGADAFTFKVNDGKADSNLATIAITISPVWISNDLGTPGLAGSIAWSGTTATVRGAGTDMWGPADSGFFAHQILAGDGSITARVASFTGGAADTAKACLMVRESSAAGARCARSLVTANVGTRFHSRTATNGPVSLVMGSAAAAPVWLRLERIGDILTGYESDDGITWIKLGSTTLTGLPAQVQIGLGVCSRSTTQLATAVFEQVSIVRAPAGNG